MLFDEAVFIGLDPSAGRRPISYAALDSDLRLAALDDAPLEDVLAFAAGQTSAVVAVAAPQGPPRGLMGRPDVRARYDLPPSGATWSTWRVCEFQLRRRGIRMANTPSMMELAPGWVQRGYKLHSRLWGLAYRPFTGDDEGDRRLLIEVHPPSGFAALLERQPLPKQTLEGRLQRQLILHLKGLDVPNPMRALEEITRHRILSGQLPPKDVLEAGKLDALLGAYTAYLVAARPDQVCQVGEREEGLITLPVAELADSYA